MATLLATSNAGKSTTFGEMFSFMWFVGIFCSTLFYAGLTGIPMFLSAPFWSIYSLINKSYA